MSLDHARRASPGMPLRRRFTSCASSEFRLSTSTSPAASESPRTTCSSSCARRRSRSSRRSSRWESSCSRSAARRESERAAGVDPVRGSLISPAASLRISAASSAFSRSSSSSRSAAIAARHPASLLQHPTHPCFVPALPLHRQRVGAHQRGGKDTVAGKVLGDGDPIPLLLAQRPVKLPVRADDRRLFEGEPELAEEAPRQQRERVAVPVVSVVANHPVAERGVAAGLPVVVPVGVDEAQPAGNVGEVWLSLEDRERAAEELRL